MFKIPPVSMKNKTKIFSFCTKLFVYAITPLYLTNLAVLNFFDYAKNLLHWPRHDVLIYSYWNPVNYVIICASEYPPPAPSASSLTLFCLFTSWFTGFRGGRLVLFLHVSGVTCSFSEEETIVGEKQVRVSEDTPPGTEIFTVRAFPRRSFSIQALDGVSAASSGLSWHAMSASYVYSTYLHSGRIGISSIRQRWRYQSE